MESRKHPHKVWGEYLMYVSSIYWKTLNEFPRQGRRRKKGKLLALLFLTLSGFYMLSIERWAQDPHSHSNLTTRHGQTVSPLATKEIKVKVMIKYYILPITLTRVSKNHSGAKVRVAAKSLCRALQTQQKSMSLSENNLVSCI